MTPGGISLAHLLADARSRLQDAGNDDAALDARALVCGLLGLSLTDVVMGGDRVVSAEDAEKVFSAVARRIGSEPVHRILGSREFRGLEMALSPDTLEPRPDTEILVETLLPFLMRISQDKGEVRILDMGTGTGAICLALLNECPQAKGVGSDISLGAITTATANAAALGLADRFQAQESDWFSAIKGRFDIIVSNPPYIRTSVIAELSPEVRKFDPMAALDGGEDGLVAYRAIAKNAGNFLNDGAVIGVEIGFDQKEQVTSVFEAEGFALVISACDYGGNDRVLVFDKSPSSAPIAPF